MIIAFARSSLSNMDRFLRYLSVTIQEGWMSQ